MDDQATVLSILVPLDGSNLAEIALPYAAMIAGLDGRLILLRVLRVSASDSTPDRPSTAPEGILRVKREALAHLTSIVDCLESDVADMRLEVVTGDPAALILETTDAAVRVAMRLADRWRLPIRFVGVVDPDEITLAIWERHLHDLLDVPRDEGYAEGRARYERESEAYLETQMARCRDFGVVAEREVGTGSPALVLLDVLRQSNLTVMTTHGLSGVRRW